LYRYFTSIWEGFFCPASQLEVGLTPAQVG
jgi:hypothetical protein